MSIDVKDFISDIGNFNMKLFISLVVILFCIKIIIAIVRSLDKYTKNTIKKFVIGVFVLIIVTQVVFVSVAKTNRKRSLQQIKHFVKQQKGIDLTDSDIVKIFNRRHIKKGNFVKVIISEEGDIRMYTVYSNIREGKLTFYRLVNTNGQDVYLPL